MNTIAEKYCEYWVEFLQAKYLCYLISFLLHSYCLPRPKISIPFQCLHHILIAISRHCTWNIFYVYLVSLTCRFIRHFKCNPAMTKWWSLAPFYWYPLISYNYQYYSLWSCAIVILHSYLLLLKKIKDRILLYTFLFRKRCSNNKIALHNQDSAPAERLHKRILIME